MPNCMSFTVKLASHWLAAGPRGPIRSIVTCTALNFFVVTKYNQALIVGVVIMKLLGWVPQTQGPSDSDAHQTSSLHSSPPQDPHPITEQHLSKRQRQPQTLSPPNTAFTCVQPCRPTALCIPYQQQAGHIVTTGQIMKIPWKILRRSNRHHCEGLAIPPVPRTRATLGRTKAGF